MCNSVVLIYVVGLDALMMKALCTDLPLAIIRRLQPCGSSGRRRGQRPDLLLLDLSATDPRQEVRAAWSYWDDQVVVVGVDRRQPFARVWRHQHLARIVELRPGFLRPYLRECPDRCAGT